MSQMTFTINLFGVGTKMCDATVTIPALLHRYHLDTGNATVFSCLALQKLTDEHPLYRPPMPMIPLACLHKRPPQSSQPTQPLVLKKARTCPSIPATMFQTSSVQVAMTYKGPAPLNITPPVSLQASISKSLLAPHISSVSSEEQPPQEPPQQYLDSEASPALSDDDSPPNI